MLDELYEMRPDEELPQELMDRILERVLPFGAMLASIRDTPAGKHPVFVGSGTLVTVARRPYVLTAGHVWTEGLARASEVALHLGTDRAITFPRELITPRVFGEPPFEQHLWGPDLAFLELPDRIRQILERNGLKAFYNMSRVPEEVLADATSPRPGAWVIMGCPAEGSPKTTGDPLDMRGFAFFGFRTEVHVVGGLDFVDVSVNPPLEAGIPTSLKGVSGGGLWWTPLTKNGRTGQITWDETRRLEGVAFREEFQEQRVVRCHWRRGLYEIALKDLPTE